MTMELPQFDDGLRQRRVDLQAMRDQIAPLNIPDLLFHYTNAQGLVGILETSRLWATNYRFLNDSSEIKYGAALFEAVRSEYAERTSNPVVAEFLRRAQVTSNAFDGMFDVYVSCFCARDNLLNQWRAYAGTGGGYALAIGSREMQMRRRPNQPDQIHFLRKVVYDEPLQRDIVGQILSSAIQALEESKMTLEEESTNQFIAKCCQFVRDETAEYLMCFKHPAYAVEEEWRLCHVVEPRLAAHMLFRNGPFGLTPYVALDPTPMAGVYTDKIPLHQVRFGPTVDPENAKYALGLLLQTKGYWQTKVEGSDLPVRAAH